MYPTVSLRMQGEIKQRQSSIRRAVRTWVARWLHRVLKMSFDAESTHCATATGPGFADMAGCCNLGPLLATPPSFRGAPSARAHPVMPCGQGVRFRVEERIQPGPSRLRAMRRRKPRRKTVVAAIRRRQHFVFVVYKLTRREEN
mmetsp:Transcript_62200/g.166909  ORF Transcript_62200/g.166909 Transcript_62200/m.166909 type:complete len:144 (+) Transcript_62200:231-662(+)